LLSAYGESTAWYAASGHDWSPMPAFSRRFGVSARLPRFRGLFRPFFDVRDFDDVRDRSENGFLRPLVTAILTS
jgi:hypothetical protein